MHSSRICRSSMARDFNSTTRTKGISSKGPSVEAKVGRLWLSETSPYKNCTTLAFSHGQGKMLQLQPKTCDHSDVGQCMNETRVAWCCKHSVALLWITLASGGARALEQVEPVNEQSHSSFSLVAQATIKAQGGCTSGTGGGRGKAGAGHNS